MKGLVTSLCEELFAEAGTAYEISNLFSLADRHIY